MKPMRRKDRQVTEQSEILAILNEVKVCRLAMVAEEGAYLVPLNFGYQLAAQGSDAAFATEGLAQPLTLYFHSASTGRKIDALHKNPRVCFELDGAHALVESELLTDYTYRYQSIIGSGNARFVTDADARMDAMVAIVQHQSGISPEQIRAMPRDEHWMQEAVMAVIAVDVQELAAKRHG